MVHSTQTEFAQLSPLQQYAKDVSAAADTLTAYCAEQGLPQPSFGAHAPTVTIPYSAPLEVQNARQKLVSSAADMQKLAIEPAEFLQNQAIHVSQEDLHSPHLALLTMLAVSTPVLFALACGIQHLQAHSAR